jgi:hypothetical protein
MTAAHVPVRSAVPTSRRKLQRGIFERDLCVVAFGRRVGSRAFDARLLDVGEFSCDPVVRGESKSVDEHRGQHTPGAPGEKRAGRVAGFEKAGYFLPVEKTGGVPDGFGGRHLFRDQILSDVADQFRRHREAGFGRLDASCWFRDPVSADTRLPI